MPFSLFSTLFFVPLPQRPNHGLLWLRKRKRWRAVPLPEVISQPVSPGPGSGACRELRAGGGLSEVAGSMTLTWYTSQGSEALSWGEREVPSASCPRKTPGSAQQGLLIPLGRLERRHTPETGPSAETPSLCGGSIRRVRPPGVFALHIEFFPTLRPRLGF